MTSLKSGVKVTLMKKLSLYIFLVLMWCNVGFAELIKFKDIKLGDNMSEYFSDQIISSHDQSPIADKNSKGERVFGTDLKYNYIGVGKEDEIFDQEFQYIQVYYETASNKIVSIDGIDEFSTIENCVSKRKIDVAYYKKKNRLTTLFNERKDIQKNKSGEISDFILFLGKKKFLSFTCISYPDGIIENRLEITDLKFNEYVFKAYN